MTGIEKAKKLFFDYSGSTFYMSRDGVEKEFQSFNVPDRLQDEWFIELREQKLLKLKERGNATVIRFLNHHRQKGYLDQLISTKHLGTFLEKCMYLECLFEYSTDTQKADSAQLDNVIKFITDRISEIERTVRTDNSKQRIERIKDQLEKLKKSTE